MTASNSNPVKKLKILTPNKSIFSFGKEAKCKNSKS